MESNDVHAQSAGTARRGRATFWVAFVLFFLLGSVWALTYPIGAAPDEPAHIIKAWAVGHGDVSPHADWYFDTSETYSQSNSLPGCFVRDPDVTAGCAPDAVDGRGTITSVQSSAGTYDPVYYALIGWFTALPVGGLAALYGLRLISVILCSLLVAQAFRSVAEYAHRPWVVIGLGVAVFPQFVFLASSVNPSAMEIAAALVLWTTLPVVLGAPPGSRTRRQMLRAGIAAFLLANVKGTSVLYVAIIVAVCVVFVGWRGSWAVVKDRRSWPGLAVGAAGGALGGIWTLYSNQLGALGEVIDPSWTWARSATYLWVEAGPEMARNMIAQFGWMDTEVHPYLVYLYWLALAMSVIIGLAVGRWRQRAALLIALGACLVMPVYVQASLAPYIGPMWQGRYLIALVVGLPILSGFVAAERISALSPRVLSVLASVAGGAVIALMTLAWMYNTRRYMIGASGSWREFGTGDWYPPIPVWLGLGLLIVVMLGWASLCWALARPTPAPAPVPPASPPPRDGVREARSLRPAPGTTS